MECSSRDEFKAVQELLKPIKKAFQELAGLGTATAKDLKGAVTAAVKRKQQADADSSKKRKVAATKVPGDVKQVTLFDFIREGDAVSQIVVGKMEDAAANEVTCPFMFNLPEDYTDWATLLLETKKVVQDFQLEFEGSALRASVGRAQKSFAKMSADPNLEQKINAAVFSKVFPASMTSTADFSDDMKAGMALQCTGLAKNTWTCVPERGHLPTASLTLCGSAMMVLVPIPPALSFFAGETGKSNISLTDVTQKLKNITQDSFARLVEAVAPSNKVYFGTIGVNDFLFIPPGWLSVVAVGKDDALGLKVRFALTGLIDAMKGLQAKLIEHASTSPVLDSYLSTVSQTSGHAEPPKPVDGSAEQAEPPKPVQGYAEQAEPPKPVEGS